MTMAMTMKQSRGSAVRRLGLLGGESSGKTSLARALADELGTAWVPEYGRQRWEELRETLSVDELVKVARTQVALEDALEDAALANASRWLICDTTPLTTLQYCLYDHGHAPAELHALARRRYDVLVVCEPDFKFVQDGARRDDSFRASQHAWTLAQLAASGTGYVTVHGPLKDRVRQLVHHLSQLSAEPVAHGHS